MRRRGRGAALAAWEGWSVRGEGRGVRSMRGSGGGRETQGTDGDARGLGYGAVVREVEIFLREVDGGRVHRLAVGRHTIGREASAAVCLAGDDVSRVHASLEVTPEAMVVADLGSKNGIFLKGSGAAIVRPTALRHGDVIVVGGISLAVHHPGAQVDAVLRAAGEATVTRAAAPPRARAGEPLAWPLAATVLFAALVAGLLVWQ